MRHGFKAHLEGSKALRLKRLPDLSKSMLLIRNIMGMTIITTAREELIARGIVDAAYVVHKTMGPGLLESIYEACFCHELKKRRIPYARQVLVPLMYDGISLTDGLRLDVLVDDLIVCELKSVEALNAVFLAQILSQLRLTGKRLGFLINFNVATIKEGIRRVILESTSHDE